MDTVGRKRASRERHHGVVANVSARIRSWLAWLQCHNKAICVATAVVAVVGTALSLSGCSVVQPTGGLRVVSTTTQVSDFTRTVVGDAGTVYGLIRANQTAHEFDPSARALWELSQANVVVMNGQGLEQWMSAALEAAGFHGTLIVASEGIETVDGDPHVWTSTINAQRMVGTIATGLSRVDAAHADVFSANAANYQARLQALTTWATDDFAQIPEAERLLVTNHDGLSYFCREFSITFIGSIIPSFDDNSEPSAADIDRLIDAIRRSGAVAVFSETTISAKLAETLAREAHVAVYSGADALYADTLGPTGSAGATYIEATIHNVRVLVTAWGGTNTSLPEGVLA